MRRLVAIFVQVIILACMFPGAGYSYEITSTLEAFTIDSVGTSFQTVSFGNSYTNPVVVCTGEVPDSTYWTPVVRLQNVGSNGMEIRVQKFSNVENDTSDPPVYVGPVHCIVSETGVFQLPDGTWYQSGTVLSDGNNRSNDWNTNKTEQVTGLSTNLTGELGVLAQIMTYNDKRGQVVHVNDCDSRANIPFQSGFSDGLCVGRHTSRLNTVRSDETVGYIVFQTGAGTFVNDDGVTIAVSGGVTTNSVESVVDNPPYTYPTTYQLDVGVATQLGENGGHGSYVGLYGADPLAGEMISLAVDESSNQTKYRNHVGEQVAWWGFGELPTAFTVTKAVDVTQTSEFITLNYSILVENTGEADLAEVIVSDTLSQGVATLALTSGPTLVASSDTDNDGVLDQGEIWEYQATYTLIDDNFDDGADIVNTASVEAAAAVGGVAAGAGLGPYSSDATTELLPDPKLEVIKTATLSNGDPIPATGAEVGDVLTYTYDITNSGNVGLTDVSVDDDHYGLGTLSFDSCTIITDTDSDSTLGTDPPITRIGAQDLIRCTASYTVTQADVDAQ